MRTVLKLATLLILVTAAGLAHSAENRRHFDRDGGRYVEVSVADPYLELHTGPGKGYPVFRVIARGEKIEILFRRTDWFRIRDEHDAEGWAYLDNMQETLVATGGKLPLEDLSHRDFDNQPFELGAMSGNFGGGNVNTLYLGYSLNQNLSTELSLSQSLGHSSNSTMLMLGLTHSPRPDWRIAPFVDLGTGVIRIQPKATIIAPPDRQQQIAYYGVGTKWYLTRRFIVRADYRHYVIFTKLNSNEDRNEWKAGFAFFF